MVKVKQFRYGADNLGYLVYGAESGMAIDGGAADAILAFLAEHRLTLRYVANTHGHSDHTGGNGALLAGSQARLLTGVDLSDGARIGLDAGEILIIHTPGHTEDSLCFYTGKALIAGDTLFNGTIGNCFSGDLAGFYRSVKRLMELPDETLVYAGHDYVRDSLAFARRLEPENRAIDDFPGALRSATRRFHTCGGEADQPLFPVQRAGNRESSGEAGSPPADGVGALAVADEHR